MLWIILHADLYKISVEIEFQWIICKQFTEAYKSILNRERIIYLRRQIVSIYYIK